MNYIELFQHRAVSTSTSYDVDQILDMLKDPQQIIPIYSDYKSKPTFEEDIQNYIKFYSGAPAI